MKFNNYVCKVLSMGNHKKEVQHKLGSTQLRSSSVERDLGVLEDSKLNMSEQCAVAKKSNKILGFINKGITQNTLFSYVPLYTKKLWTGCRGSRKGSQR